MNSRIILAFLGLLLQGCDSGFNSELSHMSEVSFRERVANIAACGFRAKALGDARGLASRDRDHYRKEAIRLHVQVDYLIADRLCESSNLVEYYTCAQEEFWKVGIYGYNLDSEDLIHRMNRLCANNENLDFKNEKVKLCRIEAYDYIDRYIYPIVVQKEDRQENLAELSIGKKPSATEWVDYHQAVYARSCAY